MFFPKSPLTGFLEQYLQSEEFRSQCRQFSDETIDRILRYGAPLGSLVEQHEVLPRCMDRLREMISSARRDRGALPCGAVVIAGQLLDGSGRFDRDWFAPEGGFWMAAAWADTLLPEYARLLPFAAGISCCEAVRKFGVNASVKWVNDVHVQGRKIGGVLCETTSGGDSSERYHLIGIGINCNNTVFPEELRDSATSMCSELNAAVDLNRFTVEMLARLVWNFGLVHLSEEQALSRAGDGYPGIPVNPVVEAWEKLSDTPGRRVVYGYDVVRSPLYRAKVLEVDPSGALVMQLENGSVITENSGEIIYL